MELTHFSSKYFLYAQVKQEQIREEVLKVPADQPQLRQVLYT